MEEIVWKRIREDRDWEQVQREKIGGRERF